MARKEFQAESKRLMDLMINSIYTHKEIFLRELISNASDAIDKLYYRTLEDGATGLSREDFFIRIDLNKDARTLTITDNGVGMTQEELDNNLGVIAKSGSLQFKQEAEQKEDVDIIGQFGVGFYSAFMVSDKVTVESRAFGSDTAWKWESEGVEGYEITPCGKVDRGTVITLHLKPDTEAERYSEFLDQFRVQELVKKFEASMEDDFNTADAISALFELVKLCNTEANEQSTRSFLMQLKTTVEDLCQILGIQTEREAQLLDSEIEEMIAKRQQARKEKNFALADQIRDQLSQMGIQLEDTREGVKWKRA